MHRFLRANQQPVVYREGYCFREHAGSPLHQAVRRTVDVEMVKTLIEGGADPDGRGYWHTPLHDAIWRLEAAPQIMQR